jgi:hypothetical protein
VYVHDASSSDKNPYTGDLPNFHIPHMEKIEWMVETFGWATESVDPGVAKAANGSPFPTYSYTLNFTEVTSFPNIVVCGLTPVACKGLFDLVVDVAAGNDIEIGAELLGLFDGEQRARFVPVAMSDWGHLFATATSWYKAKSFSVVQLLWPDRNGFLPGEVGFDQRLTFTQPFLG